MKIIYKKVVRFEILSAIPIGEVSLEAIARETEEGAWSGRFLEDEVSAEPLTGEQAVKAITAQGSDPEFFNMDKDGNEIED